MKKTLYAVFDTETVGLSPKFVYDLALVICDKKGRIYAQKSWLVREVITSGVHMLKAFYAKKIFSHYIPAIDSHSLRLYDFATIRGEFNEMIATHGATVISAYNLAFDRSAMVETAAFCGHNGRFLAGKMDFADIWLAACKILLNRPTYHAFARENGLISEAGNIRTTAESAYKFIKLDPSFVETHTALEDSLIEAEILSRIFAAKKAFPINQLQAFPWKIAQTLEE